MTAGPLSFPIHDLRNDLPWNRTLRWRVRSIKTVDRIVVHHTATEVAAHQTVRAHLHAINRTHIAQSNWPRIAYHYVIARQGVIWQCNDITNWTYHAGDKAMNARSVGICLLGRMTQHDPTPEQLEALRWLVGQLGYPAIGHKEVVRTACPGLWWDDKKAWVNGQDAQVAQLETLEDSVSGLWLLWRIVQSWLAYQLDRLWRWVTRKA